MQVVRDEVKMKRYDQPGDTVNRRIVLDAAILVRAPDRAQGLARNLLLWSSNLVG